MATAPALGNWCGAKLRKCLCIGDKAQAELAAGNNRLPASRSGNEPSHELQVTRASAELGVAFDRVLEFAKVVHEFLERERMGVARGHSFDGVGTGRQQLFTDFPHRIESVEVESAKCCWLGFPPP